MITLTGTNTAKFNKMVSQKTKRKSSNHRFLHNMFHLEEDLYLYILYIYVHMFLNIHDYTCVIEFPKPSCFYWKVSGPKVSFWTLDSHGEWHDLNLFF